jgi:hypothetical protein
MLAPLGRRWQTTAGLALALGVGPLVAPACSNAPSPPSEAARADDAVSAAPAPGPRGVVAWRTEYAAQADQALSTVRGVGLDAAGAELVSAELRVRLSDAAALGSSDANQVAEAMVRAIEVLDVTPLGAAAPLAEEEKRELFASFARALAADPPAPPPAALDPGALAATTSPLCQAPSSDPECTAGGCSTGFVKKGTLRRAWVSGAAIAGAAAAVASCGVGACAGAGSMASFFGPGAAVLACGVAFVGACGQPLAALALAINQHLCDNGVGTYGLSFQGVTPEVRCSCRAELEDDDAAMQPSNFNTLPEQQCIACPKGTRWDGGKQGCLCDGGKLPNGIDCQSDPGSRQAVCCPEGAEFDGRECRRPCPPGTERQPTGECKHPPQVVCFDYRLHMGVGSVDDKPVFSANSDCEAAFPPTFRPYSSLDGEGIYCVEGVTSLSSAARLGPAYATPAQKCEGAGWAYPWVTTTSSPAGYAVGTQTCESGGSSLGCGCVSVDCARVNQKVTAARNNGTRYQGATP